MCTDENVDNDVWVCHTKNSQKDCFPVHLMTVHEIQTLSNLQVANAEQDDDDDDLWQYAHYNC